MSGHPLRREELNALEAMGRGHDNHVQVDETIMARLLSLGLVEERRGTWSLSQRGKMDLLRRKSLKPARRN